MDDRWDKLRRMFLEARIYIPPYMGSFHKTWEEFNRPPPKRVIVGIYCCKCRKQYPPRKEDEYFMVDICSCGHEMMGLTSMCPTCGVVMETR